MSVLAVVRRARVRLASAVALAAVLWAMSAAAAVIVTAALIDRAVSLPPAAHAALLPLVCAAAAITAGAVAWRGRASWSLERVALWIEERDPTLRYALVTAIDPGASAPETYPALHARAHAADVDGMVGRAWRHALGPAVIATVVLAGAVTVLQPSELLQEARTEISRRTGGGPPAPLANRLEALTARVAPPAYAQLPQTTIEDVDVVHALVGSHIAFGGQGPADGVTAAFGMDTLAAVGGNAGDDDAEWQVGITMGERPAVVAFHDREYNRLVVLEPVADSVPAVVLRLPARDTLYRTVPAGPLVTEAELSDDIGLDHGYVEYMITTGGGESFDTKRSYSRRVAFDNARAGTMRDVIDLDTMALGPGAVLHIRAIGLDRNDVTGPGEGVSETRTLRIAQPDDSVSVNPIPPVPIDSMWISQRLLNMKTDTLLREQGSLDRDTFVDRSSAYGGTQDEIRLRALGVISNLEDDGVGGTFQTEISTKLREAVDLMYTARVQLGIAQPDSAMPHMIRILEILDEIRLANRYYLRGLIRPDAVDIERVRLQGDDPAADEPREARESVTDPLAALGRRVARAAALIGRAPQAALDSLVYIRVEALTTAPAVAAPLGEVIESLRRGEPVDDALARTRRLLEPPALRLHGPVEWGGVR